MKKLKKLINKYLPFLKFIKYLIIGRKIFICKQDIINFCHLTDNIFTNKNNKIYELHAREAGRDPLLCRMGTSDVGVFWNCFYKKFHLPPINLENPKIIIDLGANVGYTTRHFSYLFPDAKIIAIEMDKDNYELAKKNLDNNNNIILLNAAIWSSDGNIFYTGHGDFAHITESNAKYLKSAPAISFKTLIQKFNLERIDYIKMDIEGAEREIFNSNLDWLDIVFSISLEYHDNNPSFYLDKLKLKCFETAITKNKLPNIFAFKRK